MPELPFEAPLPWLWSCHHCHTRYPLGATRRCLHDGHYFCGGTTASALTGRTIKRHRACGSEFDYNGWREVGEWKGRLVGRQHHGRTASSSCETLCEYPSACHHKRRKGSNVAVAEARKEPQGGRRVNETFLDPVLFQLDHTRSPWGRTVHGQGNPQKRHSQASDIAAKASDSELHMGTLEPSFPGPAVTHGYFMHGADKNKAEDDDDRDSDDAVNPSSSSFRTLEAADLLAIHHPPPPDPDQSPIFTYPDPLAPRSPASWLAVARVKDGRLMRSASRSSSSSSSSLPVAEVETATTTAEDMWADCGDFI